MRAFISCLVVLWATAASAGNPPTLVAPRAILLDPANQQTVLLNKNMDQTALQGSIAKLMTAYVTAWAVANGKAGWNDKVQLTSYDTKQACSCMKFNSAFPVSPGTPPPCAGPANNTSITAAGDTFLLKDLLKVTLNQSTGESCDAVAEYIASKVYPAEAGTYPNATSALSQKLLNLFVGLMNQKAKDLGLTNSRWITVHGGDTCDFADTGCDPDCTPQSCKLNANAPCPAGQQCSGGTTVHDLAKLWHILTEQKFAFLDGVGTRAFMLNKADAAATFYNSYGHRYRYYPGVDGDKNGGSGACPSPAGSPSASCHIAQATRGGRPLIAAVLQSVTSGATPQAVGTQDVTALFRYGFGEVLAPQRIVDSGTQVIEEGIKDHALTCATSICVSAIRASDDRLKLIAWDVDLDVPTLNKTATFAATSGPGFIKPVSALDVVYDDFSIVSATIVNGDMKLERWEMAAGFQGPQIAFKGDSAKQGGTGSLVRVLSVTSRLLLTQVLGNDGLMRLATWTYDPFGAPDKFKLLSTATLKQPTLLKGTELAVAAESDPLSIFGSTAKGRHGVVTMIATQKGALSLQAWSIDASTGTIVFLSSKDLGTVGRHVAVGNNGRAKFATTYTKGSGISGTLRVDMWEVDAKGNFTSTIGRDDSQTATATAVVGLGPPASKSNIVLGQALAQARTNTVTPNSCNPGPSFPSTQTSQASAAAFLTAAAYPSGAQLSVWDAPIYYAEIQAAPLGDYRLADSATNWGTAPQLRLSLLNGPDPLDPLDNEYVTAQLNVSPSKSTLQLIGWRVGTATTPKISAKKRRESKP